VGYCPVSLGIAGKLARVSGMFESLASVSESDLIRRLLADPHWSERILRLHGIPGDVKYYPEVPLSGLAARGDVDILAVDPENPHLATAIQAKRVRVSARSFEPDGRPNKLSEIPKQNRQTSLLVDLGFWQVFSFVFVVVDSRVRNLGGFGFEGLTQSLRRQIDAGVSTEGLHQSAGCIVYELTQPQEDHPLSTGTFFGRISRMPTTQPQSAAVTRWVTQACTD